MDFMKTTRGDLASKIEAETTDIASKWNLWNLSMSIQNQQNFLFDRKFEKITPLLALKTFVFFQIINLQSIMLLNGELEIKEYTQNIY